MFLNLLSTQCSGPSIWTEMLRDTCPFKYVASTKRIKILLKVCLLSREIRLQQSLYCIWYCCMIRDIVVGLIPVVSHQYSVPCPQIERRFAFNTSHYYNCKMAKLAWMSVWQKWCIGQSMPHITPALLRTLLYTSNYTIYGTTTLYKTITDLQQYCDLFLNLSFKFKYMQNILFANMMRLTWRCCQLKKIHNYVHTTPFWEYILRNHHIMLTTGKQVRKCYIPQLQGRWLHYIDVIISTIASQITSLTIVYPTVNSGADQRNYQTRASLAFVRGIHRSPVNTPH